MHLLTPPLVNMSRRCWLGSKQQLGHDGTCVRVDYGCSNLTSRTGFLKHWNGLPNENFEVGFADAVKDLFFDVVSFTGDSMAVQLAQRLVCGLQRRNTSVISDFHGDFFDMRSGGATVALNTGHRDGKLFITATRLTNGMGLSGLVGHKTPLRGIDHECGPPHANTSCRVQFAASKIYKHTLSMIRQHRKWGNTLHILIIPVIVKERWELLPLARAVIDGKSDFYIY